MEEILARLDEEDSDGDIPIIWFNEQVLGFRDLVEYQQINLVIVIKVMLIL